MDDIYLEIDEDLRRERMQKLWQKYGAAILGGAFLIVVATAGISYWRSVQLAHAIEDTAALIEVEKRPPAEAPAISADAFSSFADSVHGKHHAMLAYFHEAAKRMEAGDKSAAVAIYDKLAADENNSDSYRNIATLMSVQSQINDGDAAKLQERLKPRLKIDNSFRFSALEMSALLAQKAGDLAKGRELLQQLADDKDASDVTRRRAKLLLSLDSGKQ